MRRSVLTALCLVVAQSVSTVAHAGIDVRVTPELARQCSPASFFASINNESNEPMDVNVTASLVYRNQNAEMFVGRFVIPAGESYVEEFEFIMPALALGSYIMTFRADIAGQPSIEGSGRFTVISTRTAVCPADGTPSNLLTILASSLAIPPVRAGRSPRQLDGITSASSTTETTTWQAAKMLYR